jgi:hypothetical protein
MLRIFQKEKQRRILFNGNIDIQNRLTNDAILIISTILKHVMLSEPEAEIGSVFINAKEATIICTTLEEMGNPQPPTTLETYSTTATEYSNDTIKQRRTCAMDMRFYWAKERVNQVSSMPIGDQDTKMWPMGMKCFPKRDPPIRIFSICHFCVIVSRRRLGSIPCFMVT